MIELYYVEDDRNIALSVKEYLEQKDFRVAVCETLARAKLLLEAQIPSCVLLDWNMPDGHGADLCRWIRSRWKDLPVIFLTIRGDSPDIVTGFQSGADDYVVKPFELEVLYSRILEYGGVSAALVSDAEQGQNCNQRTDSGTCLGCEGELCKR